MSYEECIKVCLDCGGKRKPSSKGSDFVDCKSVIVGN